MQFNVTSELAHRKLIDYAIKSDAEGYNKCFEEELSKIDPNDFLKLSNSILHLMLINGIPWNKKDLGSKLKNLYDFTNLIVPVSRQSLVDVLKFLNLDSQETETDADEAMIIIPVITAFLVSNSEDKDKNISDWDILNVVKDMYENSEN